jgi:hypothetical protein
MPNEPQQTPTPPFAPVPGYAGLSELATIINRARDRHLQIHGHEIKWLVELPMTDEEYTRMNELTGWSADGQHNDKGNWAAVKGLR